jgi:hypothetical protein
MSDQDERVQDEQQDDPSAALLPFVDPVSLSLSCLRRHADMTRSASLIGPTGHGFWPYPPRMKRSIAASAGSRSASEGLISLVEQRCNSALCLIS